MRDKINEVKRVQHKSKILNNLYDRNLIDSNEKIVTICADIEDQIMGLDKSEQETFMQEIGLNKNGLNQLIK